MSSASDWSSMATIDNILLLLAIVFITIAIVVACNIKEDQTDKVKGDKRLVATVFSMSAVIFVAVRWARMNCGEGLKSLALDTFGYYRPDAARARAAGVRGF